MKAVILAGGLGTRLMPFTQIIPKPLLPIGESSVIEIQILQLKKCGIKEIYIATNYKSEIIEAYINDGERYGINIRFSKEEKPLGTCGPVTLLKDKLTSPFILLNGDILTTLDFAKAYDFAIKSDALITVLTKEVIAPFAFGKIISENDYIVDVIEKPDLHLEILSGIYILKPDVINLIPHDTYYGIDSLLKNMIRNKMKVAKYAIEDYWLDIGEISDYNHAQELYKKHFK